MCVCERERERERVRESFWLRRLVAVTILLFYVFILIFDTLVGTSVSSFNICVLVRGVALGPPII